MPVGKNSIKRVANNGYSKVATEAPDMENSAVLAAAEPVKEEVATPVVEKKPAAKKTAAKKSTAKKGGKDIEVSYVNFGKELPVYLL